MSIPYRARALVAASIALVVALVTVAAPWQAPAASTRESFDDLYRRGQLTNAAITTLTAQFTESTTSSLLTRPLVSRGTLAVQRPSRVILRYADPELRVVLIHGNRMTMSWPSREVRRESDIRRAQERVQRYFLNGSAAELRREFDIELRATSERQGTYEVALRPKRKQIRETLTRLDLWVNPSSSLLAAMRMTFENGDTKTMTFENVVTNPVLDPDTFSVER
jgi:outer membrane lipoprotein-sorting protein